ncbi:MAG TPA: sigma-70 family RNA polymerase sigma factor [Stellaceae bacterium]|nr:sigma-70 family RNA polymerase sigma factor [Stellaceae bacterium]
MGRFDAAALIASFQENYEDLLRFLARRTGDADRAADIAQDTYLRLASIGPGAASIDNPRAYVYRVAGNLAIDTMRREGRIAARHTGYEPDETVPDPASTPEQTLFAKERLALIDAALDELSAKARLALLYFRVEGLSHAETAARLGISESMVAKYIAQALRHCRDRLRQTEQN